MDLAAEQNRLEIKGFVLSAFVPIAAAAGKRAEVTVLVNDLLIFRFSLLTSAAT
jgi:hypothetical protein